MVPTAPAAGVRSSPWQRTGRGGGKWGVGVAGRPRLGRRVGRRRRHTGSGAPGRRAGKGAARGPRRRWRQPACRAAGRVPAGEPRKLRRVRSRRAAGRRGGDRITWSSSVRLVAKRICTVGPTTARRRLPCGPPCFCTTTRPERHPAQLRLASERTHPKPTPCASTLLQTRPRAGRATGQNQNCCRKNPASSKRSL